MVEDLSLGAISKHTWLLVAILGSLFFIKEALRLLSNVVHQHLSETVKDSLNEKVFNKSINLDLAYYDSSSFYDSFYRAQREATSRPIEVLQSFSSFFQMLLKPSGCSFGLKRSIFLVYSRFSTKSYSFSLDCTTLYCFRA